MLAFTRGLNLLLRNRPKWQVVPVDEIYDKTISIVGLGCIGREIAKKAKGLGMKVIAAKRQPTPKIFVDKMFTPDRLLEMLTEADFVIAALPLTLETTKMFCLDHFKTMKPSAYFINIARGGIVNEADLITALEQGMIKGAGLDVFENEPLPSNSPLWSMDNVIITPHSAFMSPYYLDRAIQLFADNLQHFINNQEMLNLIDRKKGY